VCGFHADFGSFVHLTSPWARAPFIAKANISPVNPVIPLSGASLAIFFMMKFFQIGCMGTSGA
jgi:hypothetical protein